MTGLQRKSILTFRTFQSNELNRNLILTMTRKFKQLDVLKTQTNSRQENFSPFQHNLASDFKGVLDLHRIVTNNLQHN